MSPLLPPLHAILRIGSLLGVLLLAACSAGQDAGEDAAAGDLDDATEAEYAGRSLPEPVPKPDFTLSRVSDGTAFDFRERTRGTLTLLFLGYTHCPDVCPVHMANLAAVLGDLPLEARREIRVVFVSTDPERDTPERIREWLDRFDPSFIGLRGSRDEVAAIEEALDVPPSAVDEPDGDPDDYFVGHAAQVFAFEPDDSARVVYPWGTRQRDWLRDLPRLTGSDASRGP